MEEIEKTIKKASDFIYVVKNSCDEHRNYLEQHIQEGVNKYIEDRKANAEEVTEKARDVQLTDHNITSNVPDVEEKLEQLKIDEISEVDKILQKARKVREKFQIEGLHSSRNNDVKHVEEKTKKRNSWMCANDERKNTNGASEMKNSVSDITVNRADDLTRTDAQNTVVKTTSKRTDFSKRSFSKERSGIPKPTSNIIQNCKSSCISKRELQASTSLPPNVSSKIACCSVEKLNSSSRKHQTSLKSTKSTKTSRKPYTNFKSSYALPELEKKPSTKEFQQDLESKMWAQKVLRPNITHFVWYPFLSTTNENRLALHITCCDVKELKHAYKLLHNIQEILYWLDLMCLVGKEMTIHAQKKDTEGQNFSLVYSYLKSIFRENFQRIPVMLPPNTPSLEPP